MTKADKDKKMSLDGMVKLFLQYYRIPTKKDFEKVLDRIDQLEKLLRSKAPDAGRFRTMIGKKKGEPAQAMTASDLVIEIIRDAGEEGIGIPAIKEETGFDDKKLRNIIFRLNKLGKISRKSRGIYVA